ncbi:MAG TPA: nitrous oxide reductase family maturation protein NosD [Vicinamibacterales bacterium]|nr:nitrous oxide reductase family maturation protein NosD [Vicinamibacterales bacterium]
MFAPLLAVAIIAQGAPGMVAAQAGNLEGRPRAEEASPLQARIDAASPGARIDVTAGRYVGDLYIDRPVHLVGLGRPQLVGSGAGSVVRIRADGVVIEGFDIDGRIGGSLARDSSGIHVAARHVTVRDCRIAHAFFGVYLREADDAVVDHVVVEGLEGRAPGEQGSGIHVWNTAGFHLLDNQVRFSRDGLYIQASPHGVVVRNTVSDVRYGLHYMFSDANTFEDNTFERSAAGAALMYSTDLVFRRNRFLHNRGFASAGLLLQGCDDVIAEDNLIADNARGIFLEGTHRTSFRHNVIAESDDAVIAYDSASGSRFEENAFVANLSPLLLVGRRTDAVFDRNYWSDHREADLDGDGVIDVPYRLSNVFDHLRGNLTAADLLAQGLGAAVLSAAERTFPVLDPTPVVDAHPLARPPELPGVPAPRPPPAGGHVLGVTVSAATLVCGLLTLSAGRRSGQPPARPS